MLHIPQKIKAERKQKKKKCTNIASKPYRWKNRRVIIIIIIFNFLLLLSTLLLYIGCYRQRLNVK